MSRTLCRAHSSAYRKVLPIDALPTEDQEVGRGRPDADAGGARSAFASVSSEEGPAGRQLVAKRLGRDRPTQKLCAAIGPRGHSRDDRTASARPPGRRDGSRGQRRPREPLTDSSTTRVGRIRSCSTIPAWSRASTNNRLEPSQPGHSRRVDLDDRVVDPEPSECGHDMFDHLDAGLALADRGASLAKGTTRIDPCGDRWAGRPGRYAGRRSRSRPRPDGNESSRPRHGKSRRHALRPSRRVCAVDGWL